MSRIPSEFSHWFHVITAQSPFYFAVLDEHCQYVLVNDRYESLTGKQIKTLIGMTDEDLFDSDIAAQLSDYYQRALSDEIIEEEITFHLPGGNQTLSLRLTKLVIKKNTVLLSQASDVSDKNSLTESLIDAENRFFFLSKLLNEGLFTVENDIIISANDAALQLLGFESITELLGETISSLFLSPQTKKPFSQPLSQILTSDSYYCLTNRKICPKEMSVQLKATQAPVLGSDAQLIVMAQDKTTLPESLPQAHTQINIDPLTKLYNRNGFIKRLDNYIQSKTSLLLLYIDIDNFKNINDSLGHHIGDKVIQEVASRLKNLLPNKAILGHLGADEFAMVVPDPISSAMTDALSERIIARINQPFDLDCFSKRLACSIGSVAFPGDGNDAKVLLQNADTAMYEAKKRGRNRMIHFNEKMTKEARTRLWLEIELQKALLQNGLEVWYQPKVSARDYTINGAEALVRWKHPVEGYISPGAFIPVAEKAGLIEQIGHVVIREVFNTVKHWHNQGILPGRVAINLSPEQFGSPKLIHYMEKLLLSTQLEPSTITFELTESAVMSDSEHTLQMLNAIKKLGFTLSIDDFGTGYSSLSYLARFPIDELKIDRTFIKDIETYPKQITVIKNIIKLGKSLDLYVVAEGIETQEQAELLTSLNCHSIQGFYFHKPQPKQEIEQLFIRNRHQDND